ncbi:MAG: histidinol-phosphatase [Clostridia bacterium]|nr:histidinol-phosphatase [Clostridia bacterium]
MIKLSSYHTHCTFCDGKSTPREMIDSAIERGCAEIGFSSHSPLKYKSSWAMDESGIPDYIKTLSALRDEYKDRIKLYIGIEQDILSLPSNPSLDYLIGSVHHVERDGKYYSVDQSVEHTREAIQAFDGDAIAYCESYFEAVSKIYEKTHCDIIGHFDLVTKFIEVDPLFSESDPAYVRARTRALDALLETPAVFEVNTGAISRGYRTSPYPHTDVIERIKRAGKPLVVTSDTHRADTLDFMINETAERLAACGCKIITSMDELLEYTRG